MKKIVTLCLTAGMLLGVATGASAIDFKAKGQWIMGFGMLDTYYQGQNGSDTFAAMQRIRLQIDAVASETLSGTVSFEMGDTTWGNVGSGGALGADRTIVELRNAYIDWYWPNTELSFRMGIQPLTMPNVAGGSAILDDMVAGVVASYRFNDMASLGVAWVRPYNDNWVSEDDDNPSNYLDNADLFTVFVPLKGDGWKITPWVLGGMIGQNVPLSIGGASAGYVAAGLMPAPVVRGNVGTSMGAIGSGLDDTGYATALFFGLPMGFNFGGGWNIELDLNYGQVTGYGEAKDVVFGNAARSDRTRTSDLSFDRRGWLAKALVEYKMDWGTPGLFGWYGSGDDGDVNNGSEMMPYFSAVGNFTSFMGDGNEVGYSYWTGGDNNGYDQMLSYTGTWGIGLHIKDMSFVEDLSHTFRVAYWRGTNNPDMAKYVGDAFNNVGGNGTIYLTTNDYLLEFNLDTTYQMYENLDVIVQLGYIVNGVDGETWDKFDGQGVKRDGYKAGVFFNYSF